jgi:hypothetical protein
MLSGLSNPVRFFASIEAASNRRQAHSCSAPPRPAPPRRGHCSHILPLCRLARPRDVERKTSSYFGNHLFQSERVSPNQHRLL